MRILVGPPGSGKTYRILEQARARLRAGASDFRLLVPTATMAGHVRNQLAREGFVFRPVLVETLSRFLEPFASDAPQASSEALLLVVEDALRRTRPAAFRDVAGMRGFAAAVARLIDELSSAGCDAERFARLRLGGAYDSALAAVYAEVEAALAARQWTLRGASLQRAAANIEKNGLAQVDLVLFDGFFTFTDPELSILAALARHAQVILTLPPWSGGEPALRALAGLGATGETLPRTWRAPERILVAPPTLDREAEEIARRVLDEVARGRLYREIGVVARGQQPYMPALRLAFERFGIPARFYFAEPLAGHALVRYFSILVDGLLSGWDFETALPAFEMPVSGIGATAAGGRFAFAVRERMPGQGMDALCDAARAVNAPEVVARLDALRPLDAWRSLPLAPAGWAARLKELGRFLQGPPPELPADAERILVWRAHASAATAFEKCLDETVSVLAGAPPVPLAEFWSECRTLLSETRLRVADRRRNVVHVMDVYEARQWELPVVFVCGLLEKQFPLYISQNPLLGDEPRARLAEAGVRLATTAERQLEERFLFDLAASRATALAVFSYPVYNAKGEPNLPSFFVEDFPARVEAAVHVRPRPKRERAPERAPVIYDEYLRAWIRQRHGAFSPSRVESFLQCPFQFFCRHTLGLSPAPARPKERFDPLVQGGIVHEVVAAWRRGMDLEALFEGSFRKAVDERKLVPGHRTEAIRLEMLGNLRRFLAQMPERDDREVRTEVPFEFTLSGDVLVRGRIDRFEVDAEGNAAVVDYKYSSASRLATRMREYDEGRRVQGGLYVLAIRRAFGLHPVEMLYYSMRGKLSDPRGWKTAEDLEAVAAQAAQLTLESAARIREGAIHPDPADEAQCEYCEFRDGCRVETMPRAHAAGEEAE
jgi:ATP-dependent helicase/DNAse subunit B